MTFLEMKKRQHSTHFCLVIQAKISADRFFAQVADYAYSGNPHKKIVFSLNE